MEEDEEDRGNNNRRIELVAQGQGSISSLSNDSVKEKGIHVENMAMLGQGGKIMVMVNRTDSKRELLDEGMLPSWNGGLVLNPGWLFSMLWGALSQVERGLWDICTKASPNV